MDQDISGYILQEIRSIDSSVKDVSDKVADIDKTMAAYKAAFDGHTSVDEQMYKELRRMNDILSLNTESLRLHMKRTELLEEATLKMNSRLSELEIKNIQAAAIKDWIKSSAIFTGKIIGGLVALGTLAAMLPSIIKWILH